MALNDWPTVLNEIVKGLNEISDLLQDDESDTDGEREGFVKGIIKRRGFRMVDGSNKNQLLLGIDLGTSRTVVMSDGGTKTMVSSVVGYPKDIIAIKLLGQAHIIGEEAVEKRSYLELYHPLQDGVLKEASERDQEAARLLVGHAVGLAEPRQGDEVCGIIGVPARASIANKERLLKIAKEYLDIAMVVSEPFMVAYHMGKLKNSIIVDIGAGTIDICAMKGTLPAAEDQATIIKGGDYIDELLATAINESYPEVQMTTHLARTIKEKHSFVGEPPEKAFVRLRAGGKPSSFDLTDEIRVACETVVSIIVENLEALILRFDPEDQEEALRNIYVAGGGSQIRGLDNVLALSLADYGDVRVQCVSDPEYAGCAGALKLSMDLPPKYWDQVGDLAG
ncbi:MAG: MamK family actin-like protein [Nitrospinota bacterium]